MVFSTVRFCMHSFFFLPNLPQEEGPGLGVWENRNAVFRVESYIVAPCQRYHKPKSFIMKHLLWSIYLFNLLFIYSEMYYLYIYLFISFSELEQEKRGKCRLVTSVDLALAWWSCYTELKQGERLDSAGRTRMLHDGYLAFNLIIVRNSRSDHSEDHSYHCLAILSEHGLTKKRKKTTHLILLCPVWFLFLAGRIEAQCCLLLS